MQLLVLIAMPLSVGQPSQNDSTARIAETRWPVTSTQPNGFRPAAWSTARERRAPTLSGRVDVTVPFFVSGQGKGANADPTFTRPAVTTTVRSRSWPPPRTLACVAACDRRLHTRKC
jgi:hypothetical protein